MWQSSPGALCCLSWWLSVANSQSLRCHNSLKGKIQVQSHRHLKLFEIVWWILNVSKEFSPRASRGIAGWESDGIVQGADGNNSRFQQPNTEICQGLCKHKSKLLCFTGTSNAAGQAFTLTLMENEKAKNKKNLMLSHISPRQTRQELKEQQKKPLSLKILLLFLIYPAEDS